MRARPAAVAAVPVLVAGIFVVESGAHIRTGNLWTEGQAGAIRLVRGTPIRARRCIALPPRRIVAGELRSRHFACRGSTGPRYVAPKDSVLVTYVLHPLGKYVGRRSGYVATDVHFVGHGVP